ncbi:unnamed protein product [Urochloa decumbens]|uniref:DUF1618 domain-containing protein n=1 Tax=Urochloa decumbens TaxID=240449 RepID=A0ABC9A7K1_9POAL
MAHVGSLRRSRTPVAVALSDDVCRKPVVVARSDAVCGYILLASRAYNLLASRAYDLLASRAPPLAGSGSLSSSVAVSAAAGFPKWVLLEPFVFRRDDDDSFPDETKAPIRASGLTSWGARFSIAFSLAEPPLISHIYAQLPVPGFPGPDEGDPLAILATHGPLALLRVATHTPTLLLLQDLFIYSAHENPCLLKILPPCTEPAFADGQFLGRPATPRLLNTASTGLWCRGNQFVVAELSLYRPGSSFMVFADICLLRSCTSSSHNRCDGRWKSMLAEILSANPDDNDLRHLSSWQTETIIPFRKWLCWIDYNRGILFCNMSKVTPTVSFLEFPLDKFPLTSTRIATGNCWYRGVSIVDHGRELKFVNVARQDGIFFEALEPGTGFTITCHTLVLDCRMVWKKDYTVTSDELWDANASDRLPRGILMFPRVDIDRPHVVHFLYIEFGHVEKNMWVVAIDMSTKTVESLSVYIDRKDSSTDTLCIKTVEDLRHFQRESLRTDSLIRQKSMSPMPFLPCEFPKFLSRKMTKSTSAVRSLNGQK